MTAIISAGALNAILVLSDLVPALHSLVDPVRRSIIIAALLSNAAVLLRWVWRAHKPRVRNRCRAFLGLPPIPSESKEDSNEVQEGESEEAVSASNGLLAKNHSTEHRTLRSAQNE
jgi:hypothetical protein